MQNRFIADVHLGKLARLLRLLGFDTAYKNDYTKEELINVSDNEERILLSRNTGLSKHGPRHYFIVSDEEPMRQLKQVVINFHFNGNVLPFSRCIACNGILEPVQKERILPLIEKNTGDYYHEFWQCDHCKRVYWKGSHYERMLKTVEQILED